jgi:MarR family transcriptional regulator, organic hydroperoxide resistance regulator
VTVAREPTAPDPAISEAATEVGAAFKRLMAAVRRLRGRETRSHHGLSDAQYRLLFGLRGQDRLPARELADLADLSPATAAEMLDALAHAGLVTRVRSDQDRRVVLTSLTERGHALLEERHAQFAPRWNAALAEFSDEELRTTTRVLESLSGLFDDIAREAH